MKNLKKAAIASFGVQSALALIGLILYSLPSQLGQSGVIALFPFVLGVELGPMIMRPLVGELPPDLLLNLAMASSLISNFIVYATLFFAWFALRDQFSASKKLPALT